MADTCPKCHQAGITSDKCPACGVIIPIYQQYLVKLRQGPRAVPAPAPGVFVGSTERRASPATSGMRRRQLSFHGTGGELFRLHIVTSFLTLVTLGLYYSWAKTRIRQYLFSHAELEGDRFAFHGTGHELFVGAMKAGLVFAVPMMLVNVPQAVGASAAVQSVLGFMASAIIAVLVPFAIVGARRYRLSRTSWRGIRFSFRGDTKEFVKLFLTGSILSGITFGVYYPIFVARRHAFLTGHSWFGSARFGFDGDPNALLRPFLKILGAGALAVVGVIVARVHPVLMAGWLACGALLVAIAWIQFVAAKRRYVWNHTTLGDARFNTSVTAGDLAKLYAVNGLLLLVTAGLALPWVRVRNADAACRWLRLDGAIDLDTIAQDVRLAPATGEGLSGLLEADLGIG
jgi:uncharacterized membrane protein YjgN (DUF898 family)